MAKVAYERRQKKGERKPVRMKIKKDDLVRVIAGRDKGAEGTVISVLREQNRVIVEGVNRVQRHTQVVNQGPATTADLSPGTSVEVVRPPGAPTTLKRRFVDPAYVLKLFEVYFMNDEPLTDDLQREFDSAIAAKAADYDLVICADFGHGLVGKSSIEVLSSTARFLAVNSQSNSANLGYNLITKYPRADYICIDAPEARTRPRPVARPAAGRACPLPLASPTPSQK